MKTKQNYSKVTCIVVCFNYFNENYFTTPLNEAIKNIVINKNYKLNFYSTEIFKNWEESIK